MNVPEIPTQSKKPESPPQAKQSFSTLDYLSGKSLKGRPEYAGTFRIAHGILGPEYAKLGIKLEDIISISTAALSRLVRLLRALRRT